MAIASQRAVSRTKTQAAIRPYRPADRAAVSEMLSPLLEQLYPSGQVWLERRLGDVERGDALSCVALVGAHLRGVAIESPKSHRRTKLSTLWVDGDARGHGLGSALLDDRRQDWLRRGIREASVTCRAGTTSGLERLLLPRGFELVTLERDRYGEGAHEATYVWRSSRDPRRGVQALPQLRWRDGRLTLHITK